MDIGQRIRAVRKEKKWTLEDLKERTGLSVSFLSDIERGVSNPSLKRLKEIAEGLNVSVSYLLGETEEKAKSTEPDFEEELVKVPIIYSVDPVQPLLLKENIREYQVIPKKKIKNGTYFFIKAADDSMSGSGIIPGSLVLIRKQSDVLNGKIAAVLLTERDKEKVVLRKVFKTNSQLFLQPDNPKYETSILPFKKAKIVGKAVSITLDLE